MRAMGGFEDVLGANTEYAERFDDRGLAGRAARGLAVVTCMDSRISPLRLLGLGEGDAKILRNAGARVTDDVLRTLALAVHLLGVERVMLLAHTDCRMTKSPTRTYTPRSPRTVGSTPAAWTSR
jgi:carbonic anhydrase